VSSREYLLKTTEDTHTHWFAGQTSYIGWKEFARAKKGETVYVSAAAGAVGAVVCQIAKAEGLKVIGSAGSDEKVAYLRDEFKIDIAFNYKTTDTAKVLKDAGGIDIYWDNVAGPQLDAALDAGHNGLRVISCGAVSQYNGEGAPVYNIDHMYAKRVSMNGFIILDYTDKAGIIDDANEFLPAAIARGDIKYREHRYSLKDAGQAILDVQKGDNTAKAVIVFE
jgi:NADPH-dependent curcumin reductase CurA